MHARIWHCDDSEPRSTLLRALANASDLPKHPCGQPASVPTVVLLPLYYSYPTLYNRRRNTQLHLLECRRSVIVRSVLDHRAILAAAGPAPVPSPILTSRTTVQPVALL